MPDGRHVALFGLEPEYLADPSVVSYLQQHPLRNTIEIADKPTMYLKKYIPGCLAGKTKQRLLVIRYGGLGDVSWVMVTCKALKQAYPDLYIKFVCANKDKEILYNAGFIDEILPTEFPTVDQVKDCDYVLDYFNSVEENPEADYRDPIDISLDWAGVKTDDYRPHWSVSDVERSYIDGFKLKHGIDDKTLLIGLTLSGSSPYRTYHYHNELINLLLEMYPNSKILVTGNAPHVQGYAENLPNNPRVINLYGQTTIRKLIALLSSCNIVISMDTGAVHLLAAMGVPTVAIYTTVPYETRCSHYKNVIPIQSDIKCSPCFKLHQPCAIDGLCTYKVRPEQIAHKVKDALNEKS